MSKANKLISISTGVLVAFLAGGAFWLSFDALKDLAAGNGIAAGMAWLYPAIIDGAIIVFSLSVLQASLNRDKTLYPWALVAIFTVLSASSTSSTRRRISCPASWPPSRRWPCSCPLSYS